MSDWYRALKHKTEAAWSARRLDPHVYGFQVQPGTTWLPGLTPEQIAAFETDLGVELTDDLRAFLTTMNGFDRPGKNIYGSSGGPPSYSPLGYSYPRDLDLVLEMIQRARASASEWLEHLPPVNGDTWQRELNLVPVFSHRFAVCPPNPPVVLSIHGTDAIVYGDDLPSYLQRELLHR